MAHGSWLPVVAMSCVLQLMVISGADGVSFGSKMCRLACLLRPLWQPGGPIDRSRGTLEHKKGDAGIQAWIVADFGWISVVHSESVCPTLEQQTICFSSCVFKGHDF